MNEKDMVLRELAYTSQRALSQGGGKRKSWENTSTNRGDSKAWGAGKVRENVGERPDVDDIPERGKKILLKTQNCYFGNRQNQSMENATRS